jgi:hypothetical protein
VYIFQGFNNIVVIFPVHTLALICVNHIYLTLSLLNTLNQTEILYTLKQHSEEKNLQK